MNFVLILLVVVPLVSCERRHSEKEQLLADLQHILEDDFDRSNSLAEDASIDASKSRSRKQNQYLVQSADISRSRKKQVFSDIQHLLEEDAYRSESLAADASIDASQSRNSGRLQSKEKEMSRSRKQSATEQLLAEINRILEEDSDRSESFAQDESDASRSRKRGQLQSSSRGKEMSRSRKQSAREQLLAEINRILAEDSDRSESFAQDASRSRKRGQLQSSSRGKEMSRSRKQSVREQLLAEINRILAEDERSKSIAQDASDSGRVQSREMSQSREQSAMEQLLEVINHILEQEEKVAKIEKSRGHVEKYERGHQKHAEEMRHHESSRDKSANEKFSQQQMKERVLAKVEGIMTEIDAMISAGSKELAQMMLQHD